MDQKGGKYVKNKEYVETLQLFCNLMLRYRFGLPNRKYGLYA